MMNNNRLTQPHSSELMTTPTTNNNNLLGSSAFVDGMNTTTIIGPPQQNQHHHHHHQHHRLLSSHHPSNQQQLLHNHPAPPPHYYHPQHQTQTTTFLNPQQQQQGNSTNQLNNPFNLPTTPTQQQQLRFILQQQQQQRLSYPQQQLLLLNHHQHQTPFGIHHHHSFNPSSPSTAPSTPIQPQTPSTELRAQIQQPLHHPLHHHGIHPIRLNTINPSPLSSHLNNYHQHSNALPKQQQFAIRTPQPTQLRQSNHSLQALASPLINRSPPAPLSPRSNIGICPSPASPAPSSLYTTPATTTTTNTNRKKIKVRLPLEHTPDYKLSPEEGRTRARWQRKPLVNTTNTHSNALSLTKLSIPFQKDDNDDRYYSLLNCFTRSIYPAQNINPSGGRLPDSIDVYLPGNEMWDDYRAEILDEKLVQLGFHPISQIDDENDIDRDDLRERLASYLAQNPDSLLNIPTIPGVYPIETTAINNKNSSSIQLIQPASDPLPEPVTPRGHSSTISISTGFLPKQTPELRIGSSSSTLSLKPTASEFKPLLYNNNNPSPFWAPPLSSTRPPPSISRPLSLSPHRYPPLSPGLMSVGEEVEEEVEEEEEEEEVRKQKHEEVGQEQEQDQEEEDMLTNSSPDPHSEREEYHSESEDIVTDSENEQRGEPHRPSILFRSSSNPELLSRSNSIDHQHRHSNPQDDEDDIPLATLQHQLQRQPSVNSLLDGSRPPESECTNPSDEDQHSTSARLAPLTPGAVNRLYRSHTFGIDRLSLTNNGMAAGEGEPHDWINGVEEEGDIANPSDVEQAPSLTHHHLISTLNTTNTTASTASQVDDYPLSRLLPAQGSSSTSPSSLDNDSNEKILTNSTPLSLHSSPVKSTPTSRYLLNPQPNLPSSSDPTQEHLAITVGRATGTVMTQLEQQTPTIGKNSFLNAFATEFKPSFKFSSISSATTRLKDFNVQSKHLPAASPKRQKMSESVPNSEEEDEQEEGVAEEEQEEEVKQKQNDEDSELIQSTHFSKPLPPIIDRSEYQIAPAALDLIEFEQPGKDNMRTFKFPEQRGNPENHFRDSSNDHYSSEQSSIGDLTLVKISQQLMEPAKPSLVSLEHCQQQFMGGIVNKPSSPPDLIAGSSAGMIGTETLRQRSSFDDDSSSEISNSPYQQESLSPTSYQLIPTQLQSSSEADDEEEEADEDEDEEEEEEDEDDDEPIGHQSKSSLVSLRQLRQQKKEWELIRAHSSGIELGNSQRSSSFDTRSFTDEERRSSFQSVIRNSSPLMLSGGSQQVRPGNSTSDSRTFGDRTPVMPKIVLQPEIDEEEVQQRVREVASRFSGVTAIDQHRLTQVQRDLMSEPLSNRSSPIRSNSFNRDSLMKYSSRSQDDDYQYRVREREGIKMKSKDEIEEPLFNSRRSERVEPSSYSETGMSSDSDGERVKTSKSENARTKNDGSQDELERILRRELDQLRIDLSGLHDLKVDLDSLKRDALLDEIKSRMENVLEDWIMKSGFKDLSKVVGGMVDERNEERMQEIVERTTKIEMSKMNEIDSRIDRLIKIVEIERSKQEEELEEIVKRLSEAVKPEINQLIDLTSDKCETADLIYKKLEPKFEGLSEELKEGILMKVKNDGGDEKRMSERILEKVEGLENGLMTMKEAETVMKVDFNKELFGEELVKLIKVDEQIECIGKLKKDLEEVLEDKIGAVYERIINDRQGSHEIDRGFTRIEQRLEEIESTRWSGEKEAEREQIRQMKEDIQRRGEEIEGENEKIKEEYEKYKRDNERDKERKRILENYQKEKNEEMKMKYEELIKRGQEEVCLVREQRSNEVGRIERDYQIVIERNQKLIGLNDEYERNMKELEGRVKEMEMKNKMNEKEIERNEKEIETIRREKQEEIEKMKKIEDGLRDEIKVIGNEQQRKLKESWDEMRDVCSGRARLEGEIKNMEKRILHQDERIGNLQKTSSAKQQALAKAIQKINEIEKSNKKESERMKKENQDMMNENRIWKEENEKIKEDNERLRKKIEEMKVENEGEVEKLKKKNVEDEDDYKMEVEEVNSKMNEMKEEIKKLKEEKDERRNQEEMIKGSNQNQSSTSLSSTGVLGVGVGEFQDYVRSTIQLNQSIHSPFKDHHPQEEEETQEETEHDEDDDDRSKKSSNKTISTVCRMNHQLSNDLKSVYSNVSCSSKVFLQSDGWWST